MFPHIPKSTMRPLLRSLRIALPCHHRCSALLLRWRPLTTSNTTASDVTADLVTIGDISIVRKRPKIAARVPVVNVSGIGNDGDEDLVSLRWMVQKDLLGQDMFLLGSPGCSRRSLALTYASLVRREAYVVAISRDTTEADLKQRKEIADGSAGFVDQAPVVAALNGGLLVLDGIEKAERNVLPTLNNLLENREMQLEDGRFIMNPKQFDQLLEAGETQQSLAEKLIIRAHEDFRIIALGVPVPPYKGKPLDPPLRSRFQCRVVNDYRGSSIWTQLIASCPKELAKDASVQQRMKEATGVIEGIKSLQFSKDTGMQLQDHFPDSTLPAIAQTLAHFQEEPLATVIGRHFPLVSPVALPDNLLSPEQQRAREMYLAVLEGHSGFTAEDPERSTYLVEQVNIDQEGAATVTFRPTSGKAENVVVPVAFPLQQKDVPKLSETCGFQDTRMFSSVLQDILFGRDVLLCSGSGSGKSAFAAYLAQVLNQRTQLFSLYQDMTARDLIQRRTTNKDGDTGWDHSPLISAAINGDICILDGVEKLNPDTLTVIHRLVTDREVELYDGRFASMQDRKDAEAGGMLKISPHFKVIAIATPKSDRKRSAWLTSELISMFSVHTIETLSASEHEVLLRRNFPDIPKDLHAPLGRFMQVLEKPKKSEKGSVAQGLGLKPLSTRQVVRLGRKMNGHPSTAAEELRQRIRNMLLAPFLPRRIREELEDIMDECGLPVDEDMEESPTKELTIVKTPDRLTIGDVDVPLKPAGQPQLVPSPLFFEIAAHRTVLYNILEDLTSGEKHLLLIGNQGVGKNKVADRMLELLNAEREYVQLHRDSTVGNLTLSPGLRDGRIVWEDSPLVRAITHGRTLVVDEADKAPLEVVSVLKALIEDKEMLLADGRRIVTPERAVDSDDYLPIHEDFRMWVLANRPGYPFLGNDFFREIGDIFSTHIISNPNMESEIELLRAYGPSVDEEILVKIVHAFAALRELVEKDHITYPYSTREAVAVVKHLEAFPADGLVKTLENVLAFDSFDPTLRSTLAQVFQDLDIPLQDTPHGSDSFSVDLSPLREKPKEVKTEEWIPL